MSSFSINLITNQNIRRTEEEIYCMSLNDTQTLAKRKKEI